MSNFDLEFIRRCRPDAYAKMLAQQRRVSLPKEIKKATEEIAKLEDRLAKLYEKVNANCPHVLKDQQYVETGREDTLGNYRSGSDCWIKCTRCETILIEWVD